MRWRRSVERAKLMQMIGRSMPLIVCGRLSPL
jgi:hypothetical protein